MKNSESVSIAVRHHRFYMRLAEALTEGGLCESDAQSLASVILAATREWACGPEVSSSPCSIYDALETLISNATGPSSTDATPHSKK